ncbi:hypothetical protein [Sporomusa acidovorans]
MAKVKVMVLKSVDSMTACEAKSWQLSHSTAISRKNEKFWLCRCLL